MEYQFHEYCVLFPQADEQTLDDMATDIKENGLNEPIILYEGTILDGRNRYLACQRAGVEPNYKEYVGDEPLQFVFSRNLHRRHLNESQRAYLASKFWRKAKESRGVRITQADMASQFNVGTALIRQASKIEEMAIDAIKKKIESGTMTINGATEIVKTSQQVAGVKLQKEMPQEEMEVVHAAQKEILAKIANSEPLPVRNIDAEEFNDAVLSGVYDGKRYRRDMQEIQAIVSRMTTIPTLFRDAVEMIGTLEQEKVLLAILDMTISTIKKTSKKLQFHPVSFDEALKLVASLLENRFKIPDIPPSKERELLEELKKQYIADCDEYLKDVVALKKRIRSGEGLDE